jgi:hypothetical protein
MTDDEFNTELLSGDTSIPSLTMVMEQCYGGGFYDELITGATAKRVLISAANGNEPSWGNGFSNAWTTGVAGHTRYTPTTYDRTAETSGDQRVTMLEAFTYANAKDPYAVSQTEHPQKYVSPSGTGSDRYMNDCTGSAAKSVTVTYPNLPGISWEQGSFHELTWDVAAVSGNVKISLMSGTTEKLVIASSVPAIPGSYFWTIPDTQTIGNYKIRVMTADGTTYDYSNNNFGIKAKSANPAENLGNLAFSSNPSGASIYLDGSVSPSGNTPLTIYDVKEGDHRVKVTKSGYYDQSFKVLVTAKTTNILPTWVLDQIPTDLNGDPLDYSPFGGVDVRSDPDGADIWIDMTGDSLPAVNKGMSPAVLQLEPGNYLVYLTKAGYSQSTTQTVNVEKLYPDREPVRLDFTLKKIPDIRAQILIVPQPLNIGRSGYFLAFVRLPTGYKTADVIDGSVSCEGAPALKLIRVKLFPQIFAAVFKRQDLQNVQPGSQVPMSVVGAIRKSGGTVFFGGSTNVKVISKPVTTKEDVDGVITMTDTQIFTKFNKF